MAAPVVGMILDIVQYFSGEEEPTPVATTVLTYLTDNMETVVASIGGVAAGLVPLAVQDVMGNT